VGKVRGREVEAEVKAEAEAEVGVEDSSVMVKVRAAAPALRIVSGTDVLWPCGSVTETLVGVTVMSGIAEGCWTIVKGLP
jgi:hypothetical protein